MMTSSSAVDASNSFELLIKECMSENSLSHFIDVDTLENLLENISAAIELKSGALLISQAKWLERYCASRGVLWDRAERLFQSLIRKGRSLVPCAPQEGDFPVSMSGIQLESRLRRHLHHGKGKTAERYLMLILGRDGVAARDLIMGEVISGKSMLYIYHRVFEPVLFEVGQLWLENKIDVADEHYCTAVTQSILISLHPYVKGRKPRKGKVLFAGVQSELHDLGLRIVADSLETDGWDTFYYGPNLPLVSLASAVEDVKPDLLALSVTTPALLPEARDAIKHLRRQNLLKAMPVIVGGYPFLIDHSLCEAVGADGWAANGLHAIRVARALWEMGRGTTEAGERVVAGTAEAIPKQGRGEIKTSPTEELMRLTSELSALYRQLAKRNVKIEELYAEKNRFLGMAAHDLRNAIQVVNACAKVLLQSSDRLSEVQLKLVRMIDSSAESMFELINKYLDVSKIESGSVALEKKVLDLVEIVQKKIEVLRVFAEQAGVGLRVSAPQGNIIIEVDAARIGQALENLVLNAIKYSPRGEEVLIEVSAQGADVVISVLDQGPGVPEGKVKELFKPFSTFSKPGTGLGLHIAKRVVEAHGGKVRYEARSPQGSVFSMILARSPDLIAKVG